MGQVPRNVALDPPSRPDRCPFQRSAELLRFFTSDRPATWSAELRHDVGLEGVPVLVLQIVVQLVFVFGPTA